MGRKRLGACALGLLAALVVAAPAQASGVKAACVFNAGAKAQDKDDPDLGVRITGGKGSFQVTKLIVSCIGVDKGTPAVHAVIMEAEGTYSSVICGTGKVVGQVTGIGGSVKYHNLLAGRKFAVHFVATTGLFFWHAWDKPSVVDLKDPLSPLGGDPSVKPADPKDWQLAGQMGIFLTTEKQPLSIPNPETNHCVKAFTLTGVFLIDEDGL